MLRKHLYCLPPGLAASMWKLISVFGMLVKELSFKVLKRSRSRERLALGDSSRPLGSPSMQYR